MSGLGPKGPPRRGDEDHGLRRIAMWSPPRNISTAMLRSFENRSDTLVSDEPLYAHYLRTTGKDHPGAEEIVSRHESDWRRVVDQLTAAPDPDLLDQGIRILYTKQMAHHLVAIDDLDWIGALDNCFLIRDPREMLLSLHRVLPFPTAYDTGLPQLLELFCGERKRTGRVPAVIDAKDVLQDPRGVLTEFCSRLGIEFTDKMLSWPSGKRASDGVWAKHWYASVEASTGFQSWRAREESLDPALEPILAEISPAYTELYAHRICV